MDSQQVRNLQEAYTGVYDDDIREKLEFESWVNNLLEEGYDLSDYTWDELYENYTQLDESGLSQDTIQRAVIARQKRNDAALAKDTPEGDAEYEKGRVKVKRSKSQLNINKNFAREGPPVRIQRQALNNSYDLYGIILSHLLDEGYADTIESAERIMVNMSEDWRESICEANRGDEYATRGMSPEDSKTWKSERRNITRGFSSDVEEKEKNDKKYKEKYGKPPSPDPDHMGGSQRRRQADTRDNRGKRTTLTHTTSDTLSPSGIRGTVTKPEIKIGTPLGGTKNPEPKGKYLHKQQGIDAQSSDPTKRSRAPQNYLYHMN